MLNRAEKCMIIFSDSVFSLAHNTTHSSAQYIKVSDLENFDLERVNQGIAPVGKQYTFVHVSLKISEPFIVQIALHFVLCRKIHPSLTKLPLLTKDRLYAIKGRFTL